MLSFLWANYIITMMGRPDGRLRYATRKASSLSPPSSGSEPSRLMHGRCNATSSLIAPLSIPHFHQIGLGQIFVEASRKPSQKPAGCCAEQSKHSGLRELRPNLIRASSISYIYTQTVFDRLQLASRQRPGQEWLEGRPSPPQRRDIHLCRISFDDREAFGGAARASESVPPPTA